MPKAIRLKVEASNKEWGYSMMKLLHIKHSDFQPSSCCHQTIQQTMIVDKAKTALQLTGSCLLEIYQDVIVSGGKSDKRKLACIGSAIAVVIMAHFYRKVALPPKAVRCIPRVSFLAYMKSVLSHEDPIQQLRSLYAPLIAQGGGVYTVSPSVYCSAGYLSTVLIIVFRGPIEQAGLFTWQIL